MDTDVKIHVYLFYYSVLFRYRLTIVGDLLHPFKVHAEVNLPWWVIKQCALQTSEGVKLHYSSQHQMEGKGQFHAQSALLLNKEWRYPVRRQAKYVQRNIEAHSCNQCCS